MALVLKDRVKETTTTTGTGTVTLAGASTGYQAFSAVGNGNTTYYVITDPATGAWEVGLGTYTASGTTLSRDTVLSSSNAGSLVNFAAGTKEVFCAYPAEKAIYEEANGETLVDGGPITVIGNGVTVVPSLPAELGKFVGNVDLFAQIYCMNQNTGTSASADFVAYNNLTTDGYTHFIDMGINSSNYTSVDYPIFTPGSGYLFHDGDHLFIGTATSAKDVVIFTGGVDTPNEAMRILGTDQSVELVGDLSVGGTLTVTGAAEFNSTVLLSADPVVALEAATKQYVDNATSNGFHVHTPVLVATTGNLTATYNNGTSGVGATLTNSGTQVALSIDGVSLSVADRVLVWQQTTGTQNGVYVVTTVGSGSTNWVLTRSSDADTSSEGDPNTLGGGDYFFVDSGTTLGYHSFVCTNTGAIIFGTTAITFSEFSSVPAYTGGTNISVSGSTISLTGTVAPTNGGTGVNTVTPGDFLYGTSPNTWGKLAAGSQYQSILMGAGLPYWGGVALNQSAAVSGTLGATNGGTGSSTYVTGDILYASATNTLSKLPGNTTTTTKYLKQTGTGAASQAPSWDTIAAADITSGTLAVVRGGTGIGSYAVGDLLYAATTTDLGKLADVATGNVLLSGGTNTPPSYGKVVFGTHTTGTLAVANGGTGATTLTGYVYGNGTGAMTASTTIPNGATTATALNTANAIVARDPSGNFAAGTITATLNGNATSATAATSATTATNLAGGALSSIPYQSGAGTTTFLSAGSIGQVLTAGVVPFWTTATNANTANAIVQRDSSGNFSAGTITATLNGNAATATAASSATVATTATNLAGGSTSSLPYQSAAGTTAMLANGSLGQVLTAGIATPFWTTSTSANTANAIVQRDGSGNFTAGTITATLSGNATTAAALQTARNINLTSFNGSADITIPRVKSIDDRATAPADGSAAYATFGFGSWNNNSTSPYSDYWLMRGYTDASGGNDNMVSFRKDALGMRVWQQTYGSATAFASYKDVCWTDGTNAVGTWAISISGSAASASTATTATTATTVSATGATNLYSPNGATVVSGDATTALPSTGQSFIHTLATGPGGNDGHILGMTWANTTTSYGAQIFIDTDPTNTMAFRSRSNAGAWASWVTVLHSGNYNSYAPTLTGTGASGTWGISVSGSAASATTATTATNLSGGTVSATTVSATGGYTATSAAPFYTNATTVSSNYTVPANYNAMSAGPITVNTGVTVTVSTGANWVIV